MASLAFGQAAASGPSSAPIATDRPAVTDSSIVVPRGSFQAENGLTDTVTHGERTIDASETLLRFGLASKSELRLTVPDYFSQAGMPSGFGDVTVGVKRQLGPAPGGFDVSLVVSLNTPSGAKAISSHGYDPSVQLPWSRTVSANWTIAGMLSVYWLTESGRRDTTGETTFLIDRQLMKAWDAFVEYAGDFPQAGGPRHFGALRHGFQTGAAPPARRSPWTGPVRVGSGPLYRDRVLVSLSGARAIEVCRSFSMHKLKPIVATTPAELAAALALSPADAKEWQVQHTLLKRLKEIVRKHKLTHAEIAKRSGTSRTRVTAILNDDIEHVSTDLLIRILSSLGYRVKVSVTRSVTAA